MKKYATLLLALILLLSCAACGNVQGVPIEEYFDTVNYVAGMSQTTMIDQVEQYRYDGTPLGEILMGVHFDGEHGGGYSGRDTEDPRRFGMENDYYADYGEGYARYQNYFFTTVALEGFEMPEGVKIGEKLSKVLKRFSLSQKDFYTDIDDPTTKIFRTDTVTCFYLIDNSQKADADYPQTFSYEEITSYTDASDREREVTRRLTLSFDENEKLARVSVLVEERIPLQ